MGKLSEISNENKLNEINQNTYDKFNEFIFSDDLKLTGKLLHRFEYFLKIKDLPGDIVEIGVFKGSGISSFMKFIEIYCPNSNKKVVGFDIFDTIEAKEILEKDIFTSYFILDKTDEILSTWRTKELSVHAAECLTEKQLVKKFQKKGHGISYYRFPVRDFQRPDDKTVDEFVSKIKNLQKDTWVHYHCAAGQGRTTTFMTMHDMIKNAPHVTKADMIERQKLIGGSDLMLIGKKNHDNKKVKWAVERKSFIQKFYDYCKDQHRTNYETPWSEWVRIN